MLHAFVIVAYGDSPYLRDCAESLRQQRGRAGDGEKKDWEVLLATSTPSEYIESVARDYGFIYCVNPEKGGGIAADWNFALKCAGEAEYVTLAHQDDVYFPDYREKVLRKGMEHPDNVLIFTDYAELRENRPVKWNLLLTVKRLLLLPYFVKSVWRNNFFRRLFLSFGNTICCPAVTLHRTAVPDFEFDREYKVDLDWDAWVRLAEKAGAFVFLRSALMAHRIHRQSETTNCIGNSRRSREDMQMFQRLLPGWLAGVIGRLYRKSEELNS